MNETLDFYGISPLALKALRFLRYDPIPLDELDGINHDRLINYRLELLRAYELAYKPIRSYLLEIIDCPALAIINKSLSLDATNFKR